MKIIIHGKMYCQHPELGWLMLGSWGWEPVNDPTQSAH